MGSRAAFRLVARSQLGCLYAGQRCSNPWSAPYDHSFGTNQAPDLESARRCAFSEMSTQVGNPKQPEDHEAMTERDLRKAYEAIIAAVGAADDEALDQLIATDLIDHNPVPGQV